MRQRIILKYLKVDLSEILIKVMSEISFYQIFSRYFKNENNNNKKSSFIKNFSQLPFPSATPFHMSIRSTYVRLCIYTYIYIRSKGSWIHNRDKRRQAGSSQVSSEEESGTRRSADDRPFLCRSLFFLLYFIVLVCCFFFFLSSCKYFFFPFHIALCLLTSPLLITSLLNLYHYN